MRASELAELTAFVTVAEELSFRRAAARLDLTPSTLSHSLRALEDRLGVRLLNRTTRTVALSDAGRALLEQLAPAFATIDGAVEQVNAARSTPRGTVRLNVPLMAATLVLAPQFGTFARRYPDVVLEIAVQDGFTDVVRGGFDAGIRLGESVGQDMVSVPITGPFRTAIVGSPSYLARHPAPVTPHDLKHHRCIGWRQIASGALYRWEFVKDGEELAVSVRGPLVLDVQDLMIGAALDDVGLACVAEASVLEPLASGRLVRVLDDWCPPYPGFFLYYPGGRHTSAALRALVDVLRVKRAKKVRAQPGA
jgi:DNA-binding transcriptional LysR family regulator